MYFFLFGCLLTGEKILAIGYLWVYNDLAAQFADSQFKLKLSIKDHQVTRYKYDFFSLAGLLSSFFLSLMWMDTHTWGQAQHGPDSPLTTKRPKRPIGKAKKAAPSCDKSSSFGFFFKN